MDQVHYNYISTVRKCYLKKMARDRENNALKLNWESVDDPKVSFEQIFEMNKQYDKDNLSHLLEMLNINSTEDLKKLNTCVHIVFTTDGINKIDPRIIG